MKYNLETASDGLIHVQSSMTFRQCYCYYLGDLRGCSVYVISGKDICCIPLRLSEMA
jgi:predicted methyltransferase